MRRAGQVIRFYSGTQQNRCVSRINILSPFHLDIVDRVIGTVIWTLMPMSPENAQTWIENLRHTLATPTLPFCSAGRHHSDRTNLASGTAPALLSPPPPQVVQTKRGAERHRAVGSTRSNGPRCFVVFRLAEIFFFPISDDACIVVVKVC